MFVHLFVMFPTYGRLIHSVFLDTERTTEAIFIVCKDGGTKT